MDMNLFYLFVSAVVYVFGLIEIKRVDKQKDSFATGLFLFVLQFVILPFTIDFVSWFIKMGAESSVPIATYLQGLFIGSVFIAIYYFFRTYDYYLKNSAGSKQSNDKQPTPPQQ